MNEIVLKTDFNTIYNKSHRLAAAVFLIANLLDDSEDIKAKIKKMSLELVSLTVSLKDINSQDLRKIILGLDKKSLELMSMLEIASVSGLVSSMNANILKDEFTSFIQEVRNFSQNFEGNKDATMKNLFDAEFSAVMPAFENSQNIPTKYAGSSVSHPRLNGNGKGPKRKDLRKNTILEFIKGHAGCSIKDIVPNIVGCSEKTVQRELTALIDEGRVKKTGERRWSRYSYIE